MPRRNEEIRPILPGCCQRPHSQSLESQGFRLHIIDISCYLYDTYIIITDDDRSSKPHDLQVKRETTATDERAGNAGCTRTGQDNRPGRARKVANPRKRAERKSAREYAPTIEAGRPRPVGGSHPWSSVPADRKNHPGRNDRNTVARTRASGTVRKQTEPRTAPVAVERRSGSRAGRVGRVQSVTRLVPLTDSASSPSPNTWPARGRHLRRPGP